MTLRRSAPNKGAKRKTWAKNLSKRETWKNGHSYNVTRDRRGRFVTSHKLRAYVHRPSYAKLGRITGKALSIYGKVRTQRGTIESRRWELVKPSGMTGDEWRGAVGTARQYPPDKEHNKKHIYADELNEPIYGPGEEWIDTPEIESR